MVSSACRENREGSVQRPRAVNKIVRLSVHKNTLEQRRAKDRRVAFRDAAAAMCGAIDAPHGFAIVVWDDDNMYAARYSASASVPARLVPDMARNVLTRAVDGGVLSGN